MDVVVKAKYGANDLQGHMDDCSVDLEGLLHALLPLNIKTYCSFNTRNMFSKCNVIVSLSVAVFAPFFFFNTYDL